MAGLSRVGAIQLRAVEWFLREWETQDPVAFADRKKPLDLAERAALAVNGLTSPTDPDADYELYWSVRFKSNPPYMSHHWDDPGI